MHLSNQFVTQLLGTLCGWLDSGDGQQVVATNHNVTHNMEAPMARQWHQRPSCGRVAFMLNRHVIRDKDAEL